MNSKELIEWYDPIAASWKLGYYIDTSIDGKRLIIECDDGAVMIENSDSAIRKLNNSK